MTTKFTSLYLNKVEQHVDRINESLDLTTQEMLQKCSKVNGTFTNFPRIFSCTIFLLFIATLGNFLYSTYHEYVVDTTDEVDKFLKQQNKKQSII